MLMRSSIGILQRGDTRSLVHLGSVSSFCAGRHPQRTMATAARTGHLERTAEEPRDRVSSCGVFTEKNSIALCFMSRALNLGTATSRGEAQSGRSG